jgi:hypothetical protein
VENTNWLHIVSSILDGVTKVIRLVDKHGASVVTHCSDGWDRTAQITSLSLLCLDPHYRTITGFQALIEKEWTGFGHMFCSRTGHVTNVDLSGVSHIFLLFIDCVWQLMQQFPCSFDFNQQMLFTILEHLYSCRYGTFLFDNERQAREHQATSRTPSLWTAVNAHREKYRNVYYRKNTHVLYPVFCLKRLKLWTDYYMRWLPSMQQKESTESYLRALLREVSTMRRQKKEQAATATRSEPEQLS